MKNVKKCLLATVLVVFGMGFGFSEELDENIRFELNVSDSYFLGVSGHGNTVDLGFEITTLNNRLGARVGLMLRSTEKDFENTDRHALVLHPYAGRSIFNGCVMIGAIPYFEDGLLLCWMPYFGFNWDFDIIPIKNGSALSVALRIGTDTYIDVVEPTKDPLFNAFTSFFVSMVPKAYIGVNFKFGYGKKKS